MNIGTAVLILLMIAVVDCVVYLTTPRRSDRAMLFKIVFPVIIIAVILAALDKI